MTVRNQPVLDQATLHVLSNHLTVILGFVEMMIADMPQNDPHRHDLVEVRDAALEAAKLLGPTSGQ